MDGNAGNGVEFTLWSARPLNARIGQVVTQDNMPKTMFTNHALQSMRQKMDENNYELVHMLTHQMATVLTPMMENKTNQMVQHND